MRFETECGIRTSFCKDIADITGLQEEIEMSGSKGPVEAKIIPVVEMRVNV